MKWVEDCTGNLISTGFARDYHMAAVNGLGADHRPPSEDALRQRRVLRRRAADEVQVRLFHIVTGPTTSRRRTSPPRARGTNKAPGGVAYRCSFRVTEASYLIERLSRTRPTRSVSIRPSPATSAELKPEQFLHKSATGFEYDFGDYEVAMDVALEKLGYADLRREQEEA